MFLEWLLVFTWYLGLFRCGLESLQSVESTSEEFGMFFVEEFEICCVNFKLGRNVKSLMYILAHFGPLNIRLFDSKIL